MLDRIRIPPRFRPSLAVKGWKLGSPHPQQEPLSRLSKVSPRESELYGAVTALKTPSCRSKRSPHWRLGRRRARCLGNPGENVQVEPLAEKGGTVPTGLTHKEGP